jgi:hypothetical protein
MSSFSLGIEIGDFDLDRIGFVLTVLGDQREPTSKASLRMTLLEMSAFVNALKSADEIELIPQARGTNRNGTVAEEAHLSDMYEKRSAALSVRAREKS